MSTSKMLIDATHPEETRVVVMRGNRVEEFDFESASRKQLRGNIYLAKVTRVEPSLQAAFVDYGGNRHGFLAFSEIHPDYYQIPIADRQALLAEQQRRDEEDEAEHDRRSGRRWRHRNRGANRSRDGVRSDPVEAQAGESGQSDGAEPHNVAEGSSESFAESAHTESSAPTEPDRVEAASEPAEQIASSFASDEGRSAETSEAPAEQVASEATAGDDIAPAVEETTSADIAAEAEETGEGENGNGGDHADHAEEEGVESVGGADALEEAQERAPRVRIRQYKIQEVIKRRQVMLVQVVKEERGTKGAALTTYLSLAGRYSVLMPNTSRGGGISRKITSSDDRNRLKEIAQELDVPEGMGVILRTAGASRTKLEVKRDFEYLLRIWEQVRDLTLKSTAPKLVYEEGSLVKRSIRDLYSKDIDEIVVAGEQGYDEAKEFMRMLMPSHAKNVKLYRDSQPIFTRYGCESQLDAMFSPTVQLKSGGYIVINQAEALVAIDVNSGRATREHNIEDTATKTNSEAAEEIARQLRLRDLAGLIVIDFIDMDDHRNNRTVERRLKEALKHDRARIQVGRISHFGLLEMSRQRIRSSVLESSTEKCPICGGSGHVRSVGSVTLALLRAIEETLLKGATHNLVVRTRPEVALYVLNQKRGHLRTLEERFRINVTISADDTVVGAQAFTVERGEQVHSADAARELAAQHSESLPPLVDEADANVADEYGEEAGTSEAGEGDEAQPDQVQRGEDGERDGGPRRRRRRRGGRGRSRGGEARDQSAPAEFSNEAPQSSGEQAADEAVSADEQPSEQSAQNGQNGGERGEDDGRRRRRRGRRGGRRHRRGNGNEEHPQHHGNGRTDFQPREDAQPEYGEAAEQSRPEPQSEPTPARAQIPAPMPEPAPAAASAEAEAPRRRSTVREPVSWTPSPSPSHAPAPSPAPAPEPAASRSAADADPPKRGWWARRLMGDK